MSNKDLVTKMVRRLPMLPERDEQPLDSYAREVVDYQDPMPGFSGPGSVRIKTVGWWPADRVIRD
jgi:hypothetical protein